MKFITIGGVPAAGKTYTSNLLAKQNNFIALELENLRWDFFSNNLEENLYKYTQHASKLKNEDMREYYLRCALYENRIPLELFVEWHKTTIKFINENLYNIIYELKLIKTENNYMNFCNKYRKIINYLTWIIPNGNLRREVRNIFKKLLETADKIDCFVDNVNRLDYIENKDNFVILKVAGGFTDQILTYVVGKYIEIKYNRIVKYDLGWYKFHGMDDYNLNKRNFDLLNVFPNLDFNVATKEEASLYRNLFYFKTSIGQEFHNLLNTRKKFGNNISIVRN